MEGSLVNEGVLGSGPRYAEVSASLSVSRRMGVALFGAWRPFERSRRAARGR
jgi:hypothetical protein